MWEGRGEVRQDSWRVGEKQGVWGPVSRQLRAIDDRSVTLPQLTREEGAR